MKNKFSTKHIVCLSAMVLVLVWLYIAFAVPPRQVFAFGNERCTIYKIGDNTITKEIDLSMLDEYVNDTYEWSIEPTTLLYTADGRSSWIWESEVDEYLATGEWFLKPPVNITMNPFQKTNLSPTELNEVLSKGLSGYGQAFYDMEQKYGVNSIFAISVAQLESGSGTSSAFRNKNNAFGVGPGKYFNSVEAGVDYFGQLMNKPVYYGKSIDRIGAIYCVGGNWAYKVKGLMRSNYALLGDK